MTTRRGSWEIRVGIYASPAEAERVKEGIQRLLCPDPDHTPPCPVPWTTSLAADPADRAGLADQYLVESLAARIRAGEFAPGAALPSQYELVRTHGIGRTQVRRAIASLRAAGLVETVPGRGTFVRSA